mmetsp:Transcript_61355/g.146282  ORF Transcript_61355/g.146282 Transcript_61355/m.146282 type:complete len:93 (+) Transcript_61355:136-414(+)
MERKDRKKHGRQPARPPVGETELQGHIVRFKAPNGESYEVNVLRMQQRNRRTGKLRAVSYNHGWFFDSEKNSKGWLPYCKLLQQVLDHAYEA